ncbi:MAG TPA: enoyl-CoA hydratase/isomerase family protein [Solirubrobacteraceae bacterium]|nr:enoyl-CoA hydratase/isomerase family protein [Solirubrobacteraceae bacterium]
MFSDCISDMGFLQRVDVAAGVVVLRLDRPERLNALDSALLFELVEALEHLSVDEELRVVVFSTTSVRALCSGVDVKEELDDAGGVARMKLLSQFLAALEAFAVPTIAVCVGNCIGAGAEIVAGCDLRIGGDNLKLAWTGARLGVPVGPARLTPLVGVARAKELIFTGRTIGAEEAAAIGLLHETVAPEEAEPAALRLAAHVAAHAPEGVALLKAAFRELDGAGTRRTRNRAARGLSAQGRRITARPAQVAAWIARQKYAFRRAATSSTSLRACFALMVKRRHQSRPARAAGAPRTFVIALSASQSGADHADPAVRRTALRARGC